MPLLTPVYHSPLPIRSLCAFQLLVVGGGVQGMPHQRSTEMTIIHNLFSPSTKVQPRVRTNLRERREREEGEREKSMCVCESKSMCRWRKVITTGASFPHATLCFVPDQWKSVSEPDGVKWCQLWLESVTRQHQHRYCSNFVVGRVLVTWWTSVIQLVIVLVNSQHVLQWPLSALDGLHSLLVR